MLELCIELGQFWIELKGYAENFEGKLIALYEWEYLDILVIVSLGVGV